MAQSYIKQDQYIKSDPYIKADPDAPGASPSPFADDDIDEDAGDLEFTKDPQFQELLLARLPKDLWDAWSHLPDDQEIDLGIVRETYMPGDSKPKISILLRSELPYHQLVPKEYNINYTDNATRNTFVFSEADLPGFKSKNKRTFDPSTANLPARLKRQKYTTPASFSALEDEDKKPQAAYDPTKKRQPYYRKAIPKKTTLLGRIATEANCTPLPTPHANALIARSTLAKMESKHKTGILGKDTQLIQPGTLRAGEAFQGFIKDTGAAARATTQTTKTARMPRNQLLDALFACFKRYKYWSMKSLRAELHQPEAWLRENLELIAVMPKSGRFAMNWTLKEENRPENYASQGQELAPEQEGAAAQDGEEAEDEDTDMQFEDAL
jgi:transcription initiation factor TFIIF subunit beta